MRLSWKRGLGVGLALAMLACDGPGPGGGPPAGDRWSESAYCAVARGSITEWRGSFASRCETSSPDADNVDCELLRVEGGALVPSGIAGARMAWPLSEGQTLVFRTDGSLELRGATTEVIASGVQQPGVDVASSRAVWIRTVDPEQHGELGAPTEVVGMDLRTRVLEILSDDPHAERPIPIPDSSDALVVSTATGMAAVWRVGAETRPTQLTNLERRQQTVTPVPDHDWQWHEGGLVFGNADAGEPELYRLALDGTLEALGPGAWPRIGEDETLFAAAPERCPLRYGGRQP